MRYEEKQDLVSVIIPAYNTARYIKAAVDSALAQTYPNVEVVVVDDGSTDNTREILSPYVNQGNIVYVHQKNGGLSSARNTGIKIAKGAYIALLDSDDMFLPEKLERQIDYLDTHPECAFLYCDIIHFYDDEPGTPLHLDYTYYSGAEVLPALLKKNFINPLTVVMRKSVFDTVGYFDVTIRQFAEDWDFWLRVAYAGFRIDYLPETLARYRMRKASISYNSALEVTRKRTVVNIFKKLADRMTPEERERYDMNAILRRHRIRLWYAEVAQYLPFLKWIHQKIQKRRLVSA